MLNINAAVEDCEMTVADVEGCEMTAADVERCGMIVADAEGCGITAADLGSCRMMVDDVKGSWLSVDIWNVIDPEWWYEVDVGEKVMVFCHSIICQIILRNFPRIVLVHPCNHKVEYIVIGYYKLLSFHFK